MGSNGYTEIMVCTYTGRIFGLTTQCSKISLSDAQTRIAGAVDTSARAEKLREEIHELELKVQKERERYKMSTQSMSPGLSAIPMMPINYSVNISMKLIIQFNIIFDISFSILRGVCVKR